MPLDPDTIVAYHPEWPQDGEVAMYIAPRGPARDFIDVVDKHGGRIEFPLGDGTTFREATAADLAHLRATIAAAG